jgi:AcrR family transcriptional regulator
MAAKRSATHGISNREQILTAASALFIEQGVEQTSLRAIAGRAGISTGTLFYYYATKSELIFDITDRHFDRITARLLDWVGQAHQSQTPAEILGVVFQTIVQDDLRGRLHHYLIEQALTSNGGVRERFQQKYQEWRAMLQQGLAQVEIPAPDRELVAQIILAALDGFVIQSVLGVADIPLNSIAAYLAAHCKEVS